ncbi:hypothetical protein GSI_10102 [Ganoderma sinense ZZ0214-1]|uniref:Uncharacterized protein n=1 Tax=Ganoderma sinense ZZ0214-1 TaxID=1077348 RepID=A0A2G8RZP8_9APHY|nr:hypothetical protein GSI_10102 [Ganoderma sinense ZZ0214-1]
MIGVFFSVPAATDAVRVQYLTSHVVDPVFGCSPTDNTPPDLELILLMVLNATDLVFVTYAIIRAKRGINDSDTDALGAISVFRAFLSSVLVSHLTFKKPTSARWSF